MWCIECAGAGQPRLLVAVSAVLVDGFDDRIHGIEPCDHVGERHGTEILTRVRPHETFQNSTSQSDQGRDSLQYMTMGPPIPLCTIQGFHQASTSRLVQDELTSMANSTLGETKWMPFRQSQDCLTVFGAWRSLA
jgi:hypothetical protein